jgi:tetratricopeptide (TPR) repeat protein
MTLTLDLPDQLAAPFELQPLLPSSWPPGATAVDPIAVPRESPPRGVDRARRASQEHPNNPIAWARLAQSAQAAGYRDEAIQAAETALALGIDATSAPAVHAAVVVLGAAGECGPMRQLLTDPRASELPIDVRLRAALDADELDAALSLVEHAASPDAHAVRAWIHLERGEFADAIRASRAAQAAGALGPALLTNMGYAHAALGNLRRAIKITRQAAALAPRDRNVGFNLVGYYRLLGDYDSALAELRRLQVGEHPDIALALVIADVLAANGRRDQAYRVLQRVRTSREWATADGIRRAELEANLALLRWMTDRERIARTIDVVERALRDSEFQSLSIAYRFLNLLRLHSHAPRLARVLVQLERRHAPEDLLGLRMHLAVLERDRERSVGLARAWAAHDLLNPTASALAVHLLVDVAGDASAAGDLGLAGLRRMPHSRLLANNTAYALALAGRINDARSVLARIPESVEDVAITATRALVKIMSGETDEGIRGYRRAYELARKREEPGLMALVSINAAMAVSRAAAPDEPTSDVPESMPLALPPKWEERPDFWISGERLRRELGVELDAFAPAT